MPLGGIRTRNPSERAAHALDSAATGIGPKGCNLVNSAFALNRFKKTVKMKLIKNI